MLLELIIGAVGLYFALGISVYLYAVMINYESVGRWFFNIEDGRIGGVPYPKWLLFWLEHVVAVVTGRNVKDVE